MDLYEIEGYTQIATMAASGDPNTYRNACLVLRVKNSALMTEREVHHYAREIILNEGKLGDFFGELYDKALGCITQAKDFLFSRGAKTLLDKVKHDLPKLRSEARQVELTMEGVPSISKEDSQEIQRRIFQRMPSAPTDVIAKLQKELGSLKEHRDDDSFSWTVFYHKWALLFSLYLMAIFLTGGSAFGLVLPGLSKAYLPALVVMIDDLLYQLGAAKFVAP